MADNPYKFICLDPRKKKRATIADALAPLGAIRWLRFVPLRRGDYPETKERVAEAFQAAKKSPTHWLLVAAKKRLLRHQYNGARAFFEADPDAIAVVWNGLNGTRRVFADGARDAGARSLFFELCPFPDRITVDPRGVNYSNSLPRDAAAYKAWAKGATNSHRWKQVGSAITARQPTTPPRSAAPEKPLTEPFIFVPLQVPGDSQLRLFGGEFRTVERVIETLSEASKRLPDGWHLRLKEHPSSPKDFTDLFAQLGHDRFVVDNTTDTFAQVAASRVVMTVNSSVGLEAMFFEKPVVAMGQCFWAIPSIAHHCPDANAIAEALAQPDALGFDPEAREAFLNYLVDQYYPDLSRRGEDGHLHPEEVDKIEAMIRTSSAPNMQRIGGQL